MEKLPIELVSAIIRLPSHEDDVHTLTSCTLVSRTWNAVATPLLFERICAHVVPLGHQKPASQEAWPHWRIHTLRELSTFLRLNPSLSLHIRQILINIAPPSTRTHHVLDPAYAVDPRLLYTILKALPSCRKIALSNLVLTRKLKDNECCGIPELSRLELSFVRCPDRWRSPTGDALESLGMFSGARNLIISSLRGASHGSSQNVTSTQRAFECRGLSITDVIYPHAPFVFVNPVPSALRVLGLHMVEEYTLRWFPSILPALCSNLEYFRLIMDPRTLVAITSKYATRT